MRYPSVISYSAAVLCPGSLPSMYIFWLHTHAHAHAHAYAHAHAHKNDTRTTQERHKNDTRTTQERHKNDTRTTQERHKNDTRTTQERAHIRKQGHAYAHADMHTPTHNTNYPYQAYVTRPAHRPLFRHAIQDTPVGTLVACCRHMRRHFCLVWRGLSRSVFFTEYYHRTALFNETFAKILQQNASV